MTPPLPGNENRNPDRLLRLPPFLSVFQFHQHTLFTVSMITQCTTLFDGHVRLVHELNANAILARRSVRDAFNVARNVSMQTSRRPRRRSYKHVYLLVSPS